MLQLGYEDFDTVVYPCHQCIVCLIKGQREREREDVQVGVSLVTQCCVHIAMSKLNLVGSDYIEMGKIGRSSVDVRIVLVVGQVEFIPLERPL